MLTKAFGVTVENCQIGFARSVVAVRLRRRHARCSVPGGVVGENGAMHLLRTHVRNNTIAVRYVGVLIGESDNTQVDG